MIGVCEHVPALSAGAQDSHGGVYVNSSIVKVETYVGVYYGVYMIPFKWFCSKKTYEGPIYCGGVVGMKTALDLVGGLFLLDPPFFMMDEFYIDSMDPKIYGGALFVLGVYLYASSKKVKMRQTII